MKLNIVVLAKQVPDTHNITAQAMKEDGTVNRAALPAIFNPEDLNALEMALTVKEEYGAAITVITMGPPRASQILREALYRGADRTILLTDRAFAGADTLATAYTLGLAIRKIGEVDIVLCGRQAIDGDTAQIGPQVAERIGYNQITYVEQIQKIEKNSITVFRNLGRTSETICTKLPVLFTITATANRARSFGAKYMMRFKKARTWLEAADEIRNTTGGTTYAEDYVQDQINRKCADLKKRGLLIETWTSGELKVDISSVGFTGSPTKVKKIESVVLITREIRNVPPTDDGIKSLIKELIEEKTFV
jgi:electron transfer flavoprotein beta subunit